MSRGQKVYLSWSHFKQRGLERRVQSSEPTAGGVVIKDDQFSKAYLEVPEIRSLGKKNGNFHCIFLLQQEHPFVRPDLTPLFLSGSTYFSDG